jgi:gluconolactonase
MGQDRIDFAAMDGPDALLAPEASVSVDAAVCFLEGPAEDDRGNLFFSDIAGNRLLRRSSDGSLSTLREPSGRANGNTFDAEGRLVTCEGTEQGLDGGRRVVRTDMTTGAVEVLTDRFQGKRYNSPNDVVVDPLGRVWFTDPYYGPHREILEQEAEAVYRIDPDGSVTRVLSQPEIERPNGLAISPDARTLFVVDSHSRPGGNRKIWAFDVDDDGTVVWWSILAEDAAETASGSTRRGISGWPPGWLGRGTTGKPTRCPRESTSSVPTATRSAGSRSPKILSPT